MSAPLHPAIAAYLDGLRAAGKASTAITYGGFLRSFTAWLARSGVELRQATPDVLLRYQVWLASTYRTRTGERLAISTQATAIIVVKSLYAWLTRRGVMLFDPAAKLIPPDPPDRLTVSADHLSMQEATALIQTLATLVDEAKPGSMLWALATRNLAAIALALATGRRCAGLCHLQVQHCDLERNEVRVEWEKGKSGRVLPIAAWAMAAVHRYLAEARPVLLGGRTSDWLWVSQRADRLCERGFSFLLAVAVAETVRRNRDLLELPAKSISSHSLRVSFATLMFSNGCNIRSLNELMLHTSLNTTARYTPIPLEDLRRVLLTAHPRA